MPPTLVRAALSGMVLAVALTVSSGANARWRHHGYWFSRQDDSHEREKGEEADRVREPTSVRTGSVGAILAELVRGCAAQGGELKAWPFHGIGEIVAPDDEQRRALDDLRSAAVAAADKLAADCPSAVAAAPAARLDAAAAAVETVTAAIDAVAPSLQRFYAVLDDEQKGRLYQFFLATPEQDRGGRRARWRAAPAPETGSSAVPWAGICERYAAALRDWQVKRLEREARLSDAQRIALYELLAAGLRAAETLAASCPAEDAVTPLARMQLLSRRLGPVRAAGQSMRGALANFYATLDPRQQQRFTQLN
jgi:hypothetical protein